MSMVPEEEIWEEFWQKKYKQDPDVWRIFRSESPKGYPELWIIGPQESWLLKRESLYSGKHGIGVKLDEGYGTKPMPPSYGFREVPQAKYLMEKAMEMVERGMDPAEAMARIFPILEKEIPAILQQRPTAPERIRSPIAVQGPIIAYRPSHLLSERQMELDRKLDSELDKWKRRLSHYG